MANVAEYKDKIKRIQDLEKQWEDNEQQKKIINAELDSLRIDVMKMLKSDDIKKMDTEYGTMSFYNRTSVSMPSDPEKKKQLLGYLEAEGLFDEMVTVHPGKLTSFYNTQVEAHKETDPFWNMPGIDEVKTTELPRYLPPKKG